MIQIYKYCKTPLLLYGFDENYDPNAAGKDLENIIDVIHNKLSI